MSNSIREAAENFEPSKIGHIEELDRISVDMDMETKTYGEGEKAFTIDVITVEGIDYRMLSSVVAQVQAHLEKKSFDFFSVLRTGTTMQDTKYTVVPEYK